MGSHYRNSLIRAVDETLARVETDYIDLFYLGRLDRGVQVEEALSACDQLIDDGKIRYASLAGMPAWQASRLQAIAEGRWASPVAALGIDDGIAAELA